ncbi:copper(I)-binding protein [Rhodoblastus acidophilus]|uniref:copper chaperone PCu(A)C n=1 Tax=Rhodoblastus acidophilus TaxID=1074 RepID=UPI00222538DD|nr:copper chaperone PCu(A)C [Rhodoblastus acidophilus]MCW2285757.1 copper(I)-binding protein [Rhodoblastus acidophilus]MCW2333129.1 copper(I)-binding protein [Rhodoblastus acidophilus]
MRALAVAALLLFAGAARAEILLEHPWAQPTPPKAVVGRAYVKIFNHSAEMDHLVGVKTDAALSTEIAGIRILQDVPNLRRLYNIDIPAERSFSFAPGGYHILMRNLKKPLVAGDKITGELIFENAGSVPVVFTVEAEPH